MDYYYRWASRFTTGGNAYDGYPEEWRSTAVRHAQATLCEGLQLISPSPRAKALRRLSVPMTLVSGDRSEPPNRSRAVGRPGWQQGVADFAVIPAMRRPDLSPLAISARTTAAVRFASAKAERRTMVLPMRAVDQIRYGRRSSSWRGCVRPGAASSCATRETSSPVARFEEEALTCADVTAR